MEQAMASTGTKVLLGIGCGMLALVAGGIATCAGCAAMLRHAKESESTSAGTPSIVSPTVQQGTGEPNRIPIDEKVTLWHLCKERVLQRLRAPSTAAFVDDEALSHHIFFQDGLSKAEKKLTARLAAKGVHVSWLLVDGEVDSQNGFGATLRSRFECQIQRFDGSPPTFIVVSTHLIAR
jgi:hypothetical protein